MSGYASGSAARLPEEAGTPRQRLFARYLANEADRRYLIDRLPAGMEVTFEDPNRPLAEQLPGHGILYGYLPAEALSAANDLEWLQSHATGVEKFLYPEMRDSPIVLTNIKGVLASPIAEHAVGTLLYLTRRLGTIQDQTRARCWKTVPGFEIAGESVLLVGFGHIGREIARRLRGFDVRITAVDPVARESDGLVDRLVPPSELFPALRETRAVFVCCPATPDNHHLFNRDAFAGLPSGAYFLNVSRGALVDERALLEALRTGHLAGAALDVTETEPYPEAGPLWDAPNLLISSHSCAYSQKLLQRKLDFLLENLQRFADGKPLRNVVDKARGY